MKNVNLIFWIKATSLVANFGSKRFASTSVNHKQRIKKSNFLTPRPPSGLNLIPGRVCTFDLLLWNYWTNITTLFKVSLHLIWVIIYYNNTLI